MLRRSSWGMRRNRPGLDLAQQRQMGTSEEASQVLATQKVEGSSPFICFAEPAGNGGFLMGTNRCRGRSRLLQVV
jgi:hypothetical protein